MQSQLVQISFHQHGQSNEWREQGYKVVSSLLNEAIKRPRIPKVSVSSSQT